MDLTSPLEAEQLRTEIRSWLEENLPDGWFGEGFEMTAEEREALGLPKEPKAPTKAG